MAERVLITGGAGFVGVRLATALLERGADVVVLDNFSRGRDDREFRGVSEHAEVIERDLCQPLDGPQLRGVDDVYHLAAVVGVQRANQDPELVLRTNLLSTLNVLDWCARSGVRSVFLSSTSEVGDGAAQLGLTPFPVPEDAPACFADPSLPRASYAVSKLTSELLLRNYARRYRFVARIGRYHNVYGPRMGYDHVIPQLIERVIDGRDPFPIYGAYQSRAFCFVDDAVTATLALMAAAEAEPLVVNIGNDQEEIQIIDLVKRLFGIADYSAELEIHPPPQGSPERRLPDLTRLRRLTSFEPHVSLTRGLQATYDWYATARLVTASRTEA